MHRSAYESCRSLLLLCLLLRSCQSLQNDATELRLFSHVSAPEAPVNVTVNRARAGGRGAGGAAHDGGERSQIGCRELRSTKYISDGHCTSVKPIKELVCTGECLPARMLRNWIGGAHGRKPWGGRGDGRRACRCVNDKTRTQRIQLQCRDGGARTYKVTVVTSCKCKRYSRQLNESGGRSEEPAPRLLHGHTSKRKRRPGKNRLSENWPEPEP